MKENKKDHLSEHFDPMERFVILKSLLITRVGFWKEPADGISDNARVTIIKGVVEELRHEFIQEYLKEQAKQNGNGT